MECTPRDNLVDKKCPPKSYHSDIKYHITLIIIFSVACILQEIDVKSSYQRSNSRAVHTPPRSIATNCLKLWTQNPSQTPRIGLAMKPNPQTFPPYTSLPSWDSTNWKKSNLVFNVYFFQTQRCVKPCCCDCTTSVLPEDRHMHTRSINQSL